MKLLKLLPTPDYSYYVGLFVGLGIGVGGASSYWAEQVNRANADHMKTIEQQIALIEAVEKDRQVRAELKALQESPSSPRP